MTSMRCASALALADAAAARPVEADRVDLVDIGHGVVVLPRARRSRRSARCRRPSSRGSRTRRACSARSARPSAAPRDGRRRCGARPSSRSPTRRTPSIIELWLQRVGEDEAVRQQAGDRRDGGEIGDPAGGEGERRRPCRAGRRVRPRAARSDGGCRKCCGCRRRPRRGRAPPLDRGLDHVGVAAHAEIVVRAPDGDFAGPVLFARRTPQRHREPAGVALEIGEDAVALFRLQAVDRILEAPLVFHYRPLNARPPPQGASAHRGQSLTPRRRLVQGTNGGGLRDGLAQGGRPSSRFGLSTQDEEKAANKAAFPLKPVSLEVQASVAPSRRALRYPAKPRPAKPSAIIAQVEGSGTPVTRRPSVLPAPST